MNKLLFVTICIFSSICLSHCQELKLEVLKDESSTVGPKLHKFVFDNSSVCDTKCKTSLYIPKQDNENSENYQYFKNLGPIFQSFSANINLTDSDNFVASEEDTQFIKNKNNYAYVHEGYSFECPVKFFDSNIEMKNEKISYSNLPLRGNQQSECYIELSIEKFMELGQFDSYKVSKERNKYYVYLFNKESTETQTEHEENGFDEETFLEFIK